LDAACFHCGLPVLKTGAHRARVLEAERELCCVGCEAVVRTIVEAGLESYYRTRSTPAERPPELAPAPVRIDSHGRSEALLILERVRCSACLWLIEQTLRRLPGVARADVNYATQRAAVSWDAARTGAAEIIAAVRAVGYDAVPYEPARQEEAIRRERRAALWRLFVAAFAAMQVMMYAFPAYVDELGSETEQLMRWASLLLTLPVLLYSCRPFFDGAWQELRRRRLGLDTPIALGIAAGFLASAWATLSGAGAVYFDSISMLVFLLLAARYGEAAARSRAVRALDPLLKWSTERKVSVGEIVQVAPGERIPADGIVERGISSADESLLTGEARPVAKRPGDELVGGSVNLEQPLSMRVTRIGADTRAGTIARLVERATASRPRLVDAADRAARGLTFVVIAVALLAYWYSGNVWIAVAVLVATCPCALALASPMVLMRAGTALLGRGVLLTRSRALEALERATDVVLDKTGTLTTGQMAIVRTTRLGAADEATCLRLAASLEKASRHPAARAFHDYPRATAEGVQVHAGKGVEGRAEGRPLRVGSERFCGELCATPLPAIESAGSALCTRVYLADETGWLAAFDLHDEPRPGAAALVAGLKARGIGVHLASGDRADVVSATAAGLGIERFAGGMTPEDKLEYVQRLRAKGGVVAVVGDGLNDTPVLASADVSIAMGSGADAAQLQSDVVLLRSSLEELTETIRVARRAMQLVRQNVGWAIAYNALALPLAAVGWIGPWEAALGMGASSMAVLLNALRPFYPGEPWKASTFSSRSRSPSFS